MVRSPGRTGRACGCDEAPGREAVGRHRSQVKPGKTRRIERSDVLSLADGAVDDGVNDDVLMSTFADWCDSKVSNDEIEAYVQDLLSDPAYGDEDAFSARETICEWRKQYCK